MSSSTIVVGVDGSSSADAALAWAADAARSRRARLLVVHVISAHANASGPPTPPAEIERDMAWSVLTNAIVDLEDVDVTAEPHLGVGRPAPVLIEQAQHALMIVVGSRGRSDLVGLLTGSTSLQVAMHAPCPVVVIRDGVPEPVDGRSAGRVVVGVDGTEVSEPAIAFAFEEADARGTGITALHAWEWSDHRPHALSGSVWQDVQQEEQALLAQRLAGWREKYPDVDVVRRTRRGDATSALIAESAGALLTVVGSRGSGGFKGLLLGSVSHAVLQCAYSPVAIVRTTGDES